MGTPHIKRGGALSQQASQIFLFLAAWGHVFLGPRYVNDQGRPCAAVEEGKIPYQRFGSSEAPTPRNQRKTIHACRPGAPRTLPECTLPSKNMCHHHYQHGSNLASPPCRHPERRYHFSSLAYPSFCCPARAPHLETPTGCRSIVSFCGLGGTRSAPWCSLA